MGRHRSRLASAAVALAAIVPLGQGAAAQSSPAPGGDTTFVAAQPRRWSSFLPILGEEATKRGIELPLPFGAGAVYYHLSRDIRITDVRVGRNGNPPTSVSSFAQLAARADVDNVNLKLDAWILPFVNVYLIAGYIWNSSNTTINVSLPPLLPGGSPRQKQMEVPTRMTGSVGGVGITLAGGYGPYFMIYDANFDQADLGFDSRFKAVVTSIRGGWNGRAGSRPLRAWAVVTDWNTFATATGTVADPDGGSLAFEVDQGPAYRYTYGVGAQYSLRREIEFATDLGTDGHGGWYVALVPVFRF
ncbi:MAG TPA: hypothetical protein VMJ70_15450 [Candidatus Sulfotelmatobacter sp.]|nr:hypothetical protein [Candidatus Sulfotelmatobacter sp.]